MCFTVCCHTLNHIIARSILDQNKFGVIKFKRLTKLIIIKICFLSTDIFCFLQSFCFNRATGAAPDSGLPQSKNQVSKCSGLTEGVQHLLNREVSLLIYQMHKELQRVGCQIKSNFFIIRKFTIKITQGGYRCLLALNFFL